MIEKRVLYFERIKPTSRTSYGHHGCVSSDLSTCYGIIGTSHTTRPQIVHNYQFYHPADPILSYTSPLPNFPSLTHFTSLALDVRSDSRAGGGKVAVSWKGGQKNGCCSSARSSAAPTSSNFVPVPPLSLAFTCEDSTVQRSTVQ